MSQQESTGFAESGLQKEVLALLRERIVSGKWAPGERLVEAKISSELQISRAPLREALRQLEGEGLVAHKPRRGTYVNRLTREDVWEIYTLRASLESLAVSLICAKGDSATLAGLDARVGQLRAAANNPDRLSKADVAFHEYLCGSADHERLMATWSSIVAQTKSYFSLQNLSCLSPSEVVQHHVDVVELIRQGRSEEAQAVLTEGVLLAMRHLIAQLPEQSQG